MTPNKLPPLPEWMERFTIPLDSFDDRDDTVLATRMRAYAIEALSSVDSVAVEMAAEYKAWIDCYHEGGDFGEFLQARVASSHNGGNA